MLPSSVYGAYSRTADRSDDCSRFQWIAASLGMMRDQAYSESGREMIVRSKAEETRRAFAIVGWELAD